MIRIRWSLKLVLSLAPAVLAAAVAAAPTTAPTSGESVIARSCLRCHGDGATQAGLDLRSRESALKGGKHGPALVPGHPERSLLLRHVLGEVKPQMPPTGPLSGADVASLRRWIAGGAEYTVRRAGRDARWWAFRDVISPAVPTVNSPWIRGPIDAFILRQLRARGLTPSPAADPRALIRRVTFDLTGLPPAPEAVERFVRDPSPAAYDRVVDRLLASPAYGERWARMWLDLARYAESEGFKADETRPDAWRYRDYVIRSFNDDKPYDRFIREQIAGDELFPNDPNALVATGFNRHWADESNARNLALRRQEILNDITDTVGSVVLGLTVGCARCHDHKYDPIPQKDYYRLQAFFAAVQPRSDLVLAPPPEIERHRQALAEWESATEPARKRIAAIEEPVRRRLVVGKRMPFTDDVQAAIDTPAARRTALQWQLFLQVSPQLEITDEEIAKALKPEQRSEWEAARARVTGCGVKRPAPLPTAQGVTDVGPEAPPTHVLNVGLYDSPGELVEPGFLSAVDRRPARITPPGSLRSTGRRSALAAWLSAPDNPLTARVIVNRLWQAHFGSGLVGTASDFGKTGDLPSHPELLDWLAGQLIRDGWSLKRMHRRMVTSASYRQASEFRSNDARRDPENRLLWRANRRRLEAEMLRDACLSVSGMLNPRQGGPSVFPEMPEGVSTRGGWSVTADPVERNRRSVYVFVRRNMRYPLFEAFDFPDTHEPCARRGITNTAPQALLLFNGELVIRWAEALADRCAAAVRTPEARIGEAYHLCFARLPSPDEVRDGLAFLRRQEVILRKQASPGRAQPAEAGIERAALVDFCHALLNANEFLYVD